MSAALLPLMFLMLPCFALSNSEVAAEQNRTGAKSKLDDTDLSTITEPMYRPLIERYILDEIKQLRAEQAQTKIELTKEILDREHASIDRGVAYATDTITYFFYLIAGVSSVFVLVGWTSLRDIKDKVHSLADEEISKLVQVYEGRLSKIEKQLKQKTQLIEENRDEIELTQEVQSLWLRAQQESSPTNKISVIDEVLKLRPKDAEALTYKADAVLELNEPQWAVNLCAQALAIDKNYSFALYQMACAQSLMGFEEEAVDYLKRAVHLQSSYRTEAKNDAAFEQIKNLSAFLELTEQPATASS